jgi:hypothetical protein
MTTYRMNGWRLPLLGGAIAALVVMSATALSGSGMAATGGNLILGQPNSAGNTTGLSSGVTTGPTLQLTNTGSKAAARFRTNSGVPPFAVDRQAKVANLNSDLLDGFDSSRFWKLGGNAVSDPGTQFLGTTTNAALELKVNGQRALRLEPTTGPPNVIGGWSGNVVEDGARGATIGGGAGFLFGGNRVTDSFGTVAGGLSNRAGDANSDPGTAGFATVAGGSLNKANGPYSAVGGGVSNTASNDFSTIAGGQQNTTVGLWATVGGGYLNKAGWYDATVGGGHENIASSTDTTIAGGEYNEASDQFATVGGGLSNRASGRYSTIPGGCCNEASGFDSFAAGSFAIAKDLGSFVWSDGSWQGGSTPVYSTGPHSFSAHAIGGFNFWTNQYAPTTGCWIAPGGGSINCSSSRHVKKDFAPVDRDRLLRRLDRVPVTTWSYREEKGAVRHIGPMAQDFSRAFEVGENDTSIAMVDADGVSLAAIQGLYRQNRALRGRLEDQNRRLMALERAVARLSR